jgi:epithelial splicing regulatory protein 1/2
VTEENCQRSLKIRGLPFSATANEIASFFGNFNVKEEDVIIDMSKGKPTGYALVFVNTAEDAQEAIKELQGKYIGNRYVDVFTPTVRQQ